MNFHYLDPYEEGGYKEPSLVDDEHGDLDTFKNVLQETYEYAPPPPTILLENNDNLIENEIIMRLIPIIISNSQWNDDIIEDLELKQINDENIYENDEVKLYIYLDINNKIENYKIEMND